MCEECFEQKVQERTKQLQEGLKLLHALQAAGVDNWEGYDCALVLLNKED